MAEVGEVSGLAVQLPLRNADRHPLFEQPQTVGVAPREGVGIAQAGGHGRPVGADVPGLAESAATLQPADRVVEGPPAEVEESQRLTGGKDAVSLIQTLGDPQRFLGSHETVREGAELRERSHQERSREHGRQEGLAEAFVDHVVSEAIDVALTAFARPAKVAEGEVHLA